MQNTNQAKQDIAQAYNEFQIANDANIESPDVLLKDKLAKLGEYIDSLNTKVQDIQKSSIRPALSDLKNSSKINQSQEYKSAFSQYVRTGQETPVLKSGLREIAGRMDGFIATQTMIEQINTYMMQNSVIRKNANRIEVSRDSFEVVKKKTDIEAEWSDGTTAPEPVEGYSRQIIHLHDLIAQPKVTSKVIDDVEMDFESWISKELAQIFLMKENEAFINGDGINKPNGLLSYPSTGTDSIEQINSGDSSKITVDSLINLIYSMPDIYSNDAIMIMNKTSVQEIRKLKDSNGQYLWMPGILSGKADTIMGIPLYTMSNIPSVASGNICAIFANLSCAYTIVDHSNIAIQIDRYTSKPFITFYSTKRVGGDVTNGRAIKLLKVAA